MTTIRNGDKAEICSIMRTAKAFGDSHALAGISDVLRVLGYNADRENCTISPLVAERERYELTEEERKFADTEDTRCRWYVSSVQLDRMARAAKLIREAFGEVTKDLLDEAKRIYDEPLPKSVDAGNKLVAYIVYRLWDCNCGDEAVLIENGNFTSLIAKETKAGK